MEFNWASLKEILFAIGSVAGIFAFIRPLLESKLQRDAARIEHVKSLITEQNLAELEFNIYQRRQIPIKDFYPFDQLAREKQINQDSVRFTGPSSKALSRELDALLAHYSSLREFVQVPAWEPMERIVGEAKHEIWAFNKKAFEDEDRIPRGYDKHLNFAAQKAEEMRKAFQRFQLVSELHLFEIPFSRLLLRQRFKTYGV